MLIKKLLWTACAAIALTASAGINAEEYVVGTGATYRPFEYETPQKELVGFDVDLMRAIAKAEGFDVKFINTPWEGIFATVDKGDRDIIMSGITITDKRKQVVDFSKPYFLAHQLILTDKSVKINKLSDLSKGSVAVVSCSAGDGLRELLSRNASFRSDSADAVRDPSVLHSSDRRPLNFR